jgi:hypothetical protein
MRTLITILLFASTQADEKQVVRRCIQDSCGIVSIVGTTVRFRETDSGPHFLPAYDIGSYDREAQRWVPTNEAALRHVNMPNRWSAVVSASLDHYDSSGGPTVRLRAFTPTGENQLTYDGYFFFDDIESGMLFGTPDVVLSIQTGGASSSVQDAVVWLISDSGKPKEILRVNGILVRFQATGSGVSGLPGVWIDRDTYDGVHSETRGRKREFWRWDSSSKSLRRVTAG